MAENPNMITFDEEPNGALHIAFAGSPNELPEKSDTETKQQQDKQPSMITFDEMPNMAQVARDDPRYRNAVENPVQKVIKPTETNAKSNVLAHILEQMGRPEDVFHMAPQVTDIVLNPDSSLDAKQTAETEYVNVDSISAGLLKSYDDLVSLSKMEDGLRNYADAEAVTKERIPVYIHFMIGNIVVKDVSCYSGDKLQFPTDSEIAKAMGESWNPQQFIGWDSDGIAHTSTDIHASLRKMFSVRVLLESNVIGDVRVPEGTKVIKVLEDNLEKLHLVLPIFTNYSIYCASKIVTEDTVINLEPKNKQAASTVMSQKEMVVVFAIKPSYLGIDVSTMSKEELREATIIWRTTVPYGSPVQPPSDELLREHGMMLPFEKYYEWSSDLSSIRSNVVIKAMPLNTASKSANLVETVRNTQKDDIILGGIAVAKRAYNAIRCPMMLYMEKKLVKEFEGGRKVRARDFVFLRKGNDLMLYKYTGVKPCVEIPAVVNNMYVKHIHPNAFTRGPLKLRNLWKSRKELFSTDNFEQSNTRMQQLILPTTIVYLPGNFLYKTTNVETLVVPESVSEISPNAFAGSSITEVYFEGACPRGFRRDNIQADIFVRRANFKSFFA